MCHVNQQNRCDPSPTGRVVVQNTERGTEWQHRQSQQRAATEGEQVNRRGE
jgi:hypothetical protein